VSKRPTLPARVNTRLRNEIGRLLFALAIGLAKTSSLSFSQMRLLARIPSSYDAFSRWQLGRTKRVEPAMAVEGVRNVVLQAEADRFALGTEAPNFLDGRVRQLRPSAILEFGGGVSTVVLAACMSDIHGSDSPRVFSVDESEGYLHETRRMLDDAGLAGCARLAHREVREQTFWGRRTPCYDLDDAFLRAFLETVPELLLVDGPSGGGMVRLGTLALALGHVGLPCTFFLDDALREDEINVASLWQEVPEVELRTVHLVGHGLLEGRIVG